MTYLKNQYPELHRLMLHYFYVLSDIEVAGSIPEIMDKYLNEVKTEQLNNAIKEIHSINAQDLPEEKVEEILFGLGFDLGIDNDDWKPPAHTHKELLVALKVMMENELASRSI